MKLISILVMSIAILATMNGISLAQTASIYAEKHEQLQAQLNDLKAQLKDSTTFIVEEAEPRLKDQAALIKSAPEDTERMIEDLESLVDKFKAGSEIYTTVQESIDNASRYYDKFREGSENQKKAAEMILTSRTRLENTDKQRDELVGEAKASIAVLKGHKDDLIALQIAGAYEEMANVYEGMIASFKETVESSSDVANSLATAVELPTE